eukprot:GHVU01105629.1.p2 GENE.GHVU01105629.1~~GHVU01105629.1.p2  ORF type:complete len:149 (-),score=11.38 GHVU01105629.1:2046-2492(-)
MATTTGGGSLPSLPASLHDEPRIPGSAGLPLAAPGRPPHVAHVASQGPDRPTDRSYIFDTSKPLIESVIRNSTQTDRHTDRDRDTDRHRHKQTRKRACTQTRTQAGAQKRTQTGARKRTKTGTQTRTPTRTQTRKRVCTDVHIYPANR